jgi:D-alanyl-lipoteichoic acid acyltransferase DltB (MBOAT superfamily)
LRSWAWAFDRALDGPARGAADYAFYTFYWPAFASGPFFSPHQLGERRQAWYWTDAGEPGAQPLGPALRRIARGFAALALLTLAAWSLTPEAYLRATAGPVGHAWLHTIGVYFAVYLGFSAWTDASVGFAQLSGVVLPENFDHAERAYGPADFWRRWNVSLGAWMHEYVYVPLGGAHPGGRRDRLAWWNIAAVFAAVALYHHVGGLKLLGPGVAVLPGFWLPWSLWALYNTLGTLVTRRWRAPERFGFRDWAVIAVTFAFSAVGLTTAFYPLTLPIADVLGLYRTLLLGGLP